MTTIWRTSDPRRGIVFLLLLGTLLPGCTGPWAPSRSLNVANPFGTGGEKRFALIIGNADYAATPLRNAVNDARAMATTLRMVGFEVSTLENASLNAMKKAIDDFGDALRSGGVGLFYFAGHGIQVQGRNFLLPIGARIMGERDIEYESLDVGRVLGKMEDAGNPINVVILDACRDNPFAGSVRSAASGLAALDAASGTFVAYATAPGRTAADGTGGHGLYTEQLMRHLTTPGLKVEEVFKRVRVAVEQQSHGKQVPWESSSLTGDFYFAGAPPEPVAAVPAAPLVGLARANEPTRTINEEEALWKIIETSTKTIDFEEYLHAFPSGRFVPAARAKLRQLQFPDIPPSGQRAPQAPSEADLPAPIVLGFSCSKVIFWHQKLICVDDGLAVLEVQMAHLYIAALPRTADTEARKQAQLGWLKARHDACSDSACLLRVYQERLAELSR